MRTFLFAILFLVVSNQSYSQAAKKPNIILILADDLGFADLGCYGNRYIRTPNIDKLSATGLKFLQAYAASPVCSPSRAAILTGRYPSRLPITNYLEGRTGDTTSNLLPATFLRSLPAKETTVAEALRAHGYKTAMIGKWHLGSDADSQPNSHGFEYERVADNKLFYYNFNLLSKGKPIYTSVENENLTDRLTEEAEAFITKNRDSSFFLLLSHFAPHLVLQPKPQKLPAYYFSYNKLSNGRYDPQYAATIETLDDNIGILLKKLEELELLDNTIVIFTSDNGGVSTKELGIKPTDNSPLRAGKGHVYEGGIRIPLIISWKNNIKPGTDESNYIINTDLFPTILELTESKASYRLDGISIVPALKGGKLPKDRRLFWHYPHFSNQGGRPAAAMRQGDFKLVEFYESGRLELYNLREDIGEAQDLAITDGNRVDEMKKLLDQWRKETAANMPTIKNK